MNGVAPSDRVTRVATGDIVDIDLPDVVAAAPPGPNPDIAIHVVYEDDDVLVIDKPVGLVVHPGAGHADDTLVNGLLARYPELASVGESTRPGIVHRLDRDTTGLLIVARTSDAYTALVAALADRDVSRVYEVICLGHTGTARGVIDAPIGRSRRSRVRMAVSTEGRPARTHYEQRRQYVDPIDATWFECRLETGRTHQIRVHLAAIGTPVMGDSLYGRLDQLGTSRQQLHAARLEFAHPTSGEAMEFVSPLPPDMVDTLERLGETTFETD